MPEAAAPRPRSPAGSDTREKILAAACSLFAEHGYTATSVRMIARSLGLTDPAVHYYFPTKQALWEALMVEPDYGPLPLDRLPFSREAMIEQVMHLFGWWIARPEFGQMLLREQLSSEQASVGFMKTSDNTWYPNITVPLHLLVGDDAEDVSAMLFELLAGIFWDAILSYGQLFSEVVHADYFQQRVRAIVDLALPGPRLAMA